MNGCRRRQRGAGLLVVMVWIAIAVLVGTLGFSLAPSYLQYWTVRSVMNGMAEDPELQGKGRAQVMSNLASRLDVNGVEGLPAGAFNLEQGAYNRELVADYEVRVPVVSNIDAVISFSYRVAVPNQ